MSTFNGADIATLVLGDIRTVEPMEGFIKAPRGEKAFADFLDRHIFGTGEAMRGNVSVNVAARIGDVLQGGRQRSLVVLLSSGCTFEALADYAFEFVAGPTLQAPPRMQRSLRCEHRIRRSRISRRPPRPRTSDRAQVLRPRLVRSQLPPGRWRRR